MHHSPPHHCLQCGRHISAHPRDLVCPDCRAKISPALIIDGPFALLVLAGMAATALLLYYLPDAIRATLSVF